MPGIGSIVCDQQSAVLDVIGKKIEAPKSVISFSNNQSDAAPLLQFIQEEYNCDNEEATRKLNNFVKRLITLKTSEKVSVGALGNLRKTKADQFELVSNSKLSGYYNDVTATRLVKINSPHAILVGDKETTREAMQEFYVPKETVWRSKYWIASVIILVISAALILAHYFYFNGNNIFGNHMGF